MKHTIFTIYATEANHVLVTSNPCHVVWWGRLLSDHVHEEEEPTPVFCVNSSTISLFKDQYLHHKSKHINTSIVSFTSLLTMSTPFYIFYIFFKSYDQLENIFNKPFVEYHFEFHRQNLGIICIIIYNSQN